MRAIERKQDGAQVRGNTGETEWRESWRSGDGAEAVLSEGWRDAAYDGWSEGVTEQRGDRAEGDGVEDHEQ